MSLGCGRNVQALRAESFEWICSNVQHAWDIRHFAGVRARLAHYLPIGSNDPQDMQHEVALRWYGTGADEKVEDRLFVCGATPLRRPSWTANPRPKLCFSERRSSKTPTLGETYSKNLKSTNQGKQSWTARLIVLLEL